MGVGYASGGEQPKRTEKYSKSHPYRTDLLDKLPQRLELCCKSVYFGVRNKLGKIQNTNVVDGFLCGDLCDGVFLCN